MSMAPDRMKDQEDRDFYKLALMLTGCSIRENWSCPAPVAKSLKVEGLHLTRVA